MALSTWQVVVSSQDKCISSIYRGLALGSLPSHLLTQVLTGLINSPATPLHAFLLLWSLFLDSSLRARSWLLQGQGLFYWEKELGRRPGRQNEGTSLTPQISPRGQRLAHLHAA